MKRWSRVPLAKSSQVVTLGGGPTTDIDFVWLVVWLVLFFPCIPYIQFNLFVPMYIPCWELTISPFKGTFKDDFPFPQVGYMSLSGGYIFYPMNQIIHWSNHSFSRGYDPKALGWSAFTSRLARSQFQSSWWPLLGSSFVMLMGKVGTQILVFHVFARSMWNVYYTSVGSMYGIYIYVYLHLPYMDPIMG